MLRYRWGGKPMVIAVPLTWLLLFFLVPFIIVLKISFSEAVLAMPPYAPLWKWVGAHASRIKFNLNLANYRYLFTDNLYLSAYLYSVRVAALSTLLCLLLGYPMAYGIARAAPVRRSLLLMLVILPFWTSFLLRVYAWIGLLKTNGVINNVLLALGVIDEPITMMQTDFAVYIGIVYSYLPFMILPLYANLEKHDKTLLGRPDQLMIGRVLSDEFFANRDWPVASAVAIAMLVLLAAPILVFRRYQGRELEARQ
jgi:putrescine transport system permease protein